MIRSLVLAPLLVAGVMVLEIHAHHHHVGSLVSGALTFAKDTVTSAVNGAKDAVNGAKEVVAPPVAEVISTAVDGAKEVAVIATDPKPIFPGTRWCGAGHRAKNESDVGIFEGPDLCCRDHDNCPNNIQAGSERLGLNNTGTYTLSHCDCDEAFYRCLKQDNSLIAKKIGFTYFNVLRPRCFRQDRPIVRCAKTTGVALRKRCQQYELDQQSRDLKWQWFDAEEF